MSRRRRKRQVTGMSEWEVRIDDLTEAQRAVAELIGLENYRKLVNVYAGELIYIPKSDSFDRLVRNQKIVDEFNGTNTGELARRYHLTPVTIRRIVDEKRKSLMCAPLDGQLSMFDP